MNEEQLRHAVESVLSRPQYLSWFCAAIGADLDGPSAATEFFTRAATSDISPVRFFDAEWFRSKYRINGSNAFLSYMRDDRQRLAAPSPAFAPRWYCRRYRLDSSAHPLVDFLLHGDDRNPHPLLDIKYLQGQCATWRTGSVALDYLVDREKFWLDPHPLFDAKGYFTNYPDIAAAGANPLEHYLQFGHVEGRRPNRLFSARWYQEACIRYRDRARIDPLTSYVVRGCYLPETPAPGLRALAKTSIKLTEHGPEPYINCLREGRGLYAALRHRPNLDADAFQGYLHGKLQDYNPSLPEDLVLLRKPRIALMYSHKCASATILYWWLEQAGLLDTALGFSRWSHSFQNLYRHSRDYIDAALTFDPGRYQVYKFARHPLLRAVSSFTHFLNFPETFTVSANSNRISFLEFLELVGASQFMNDDGHVRPQRTKLEADGTIVPRILKIEDGLQFHFRSLEATHGLPAATFERHPEIRAVLRVHTKQDRGAMAVGPDAKVPFGVIPEYKTLMTPEAARKVYELYRMDFAAYGYSTEVQRRGRSRRPDVRQDDNSGFALPASASLAAE